LFHIVHLILPLQACFPFLLSYNILHCRRNLNSANVCASDDLKHFPFVAGSNC
jgi:hypothetical protein